MEVQLESRAFAFPPGDADSDNALAATTAPPQLDSLSRLISARMYLFGLFSALRGIHRILGNPYKATDDGTGYDRESILFHAIQSVLVSLLFLGVLCVLYLFNLSELAIAVVVIKIGLVNPIMARLAFTGDDFVLPFIGEHAQSVKTLLWDGESDRNAVYFAGNRPFVGYGTEINAWSVVIDTSVAAQGIHVLAGVEDEPNVLSEEKLYEAISHAARELGVSRMAIKHLAFIEGRSVSSQARDDSERFERPPAYLPSEQIAAIDRKSEFGRRYMQLEISQPDSDILASQFIRFKSEGKLMSCEFSTYVLPPGNRKLANTKRYFQWHWLAYLALPTLLVVVLLALLTYPAMFLPIPGSLHHPVFIMPLLACVFLLLILGWRTLCRLCTAAGIFLRIPLQFGVSFSYRERNSSGADLDYFAQQQISRLLKTQEKVLLKAICEQLKLHRIDPSDFKENLVAYINQGVINSGEIRGNVINSIKSFVLRKPIQPSVRQKGRAKS